MSQEQVEVIGSHLPEAAISEIGFGERKAAVTERVHLVTCKPCSSKVKAQKKEARRIRRLGERPISLWR